MTLRVYFGMFEWHVLKVMLFSTASILIAGCNQSKNLSPKETGPTTQKQTKAVTKSKINTPDQEPAIATLGGGCFWCVEAVFERIKGVKSVISGYAGGITEDPTYEMVCLGATGHAEICQIHYDPDIISYETLLEVFWLCHDPTTLNQQGNDTGTQYRSIIFHHNEAQKISAEAAIAKAATKFTDKIVTEVVPLKKFYIAEEYHQNFYAKNPDNPYCAVTIPPKLLKIEGLEIYSQRP